MNDLPCEDATLVSAAQGGDQGAFGMLVERYQDRIYNTLLRILGSRDDALDVVQEALVQAYIKLGSFRGESKFYTWLYRIAINMALSHRRRAGRSGPAVSIEDLKERMGDEPVSKQPAPISGLISDERALVVKRALAEVSDSYCQILVLREMEDCSYQQIAEILELPVGTVRSRLFRARLQLKVKLQELMPEEQVFE
ncbi:MAG: sigma-70 family RNA polymerase sigma factor [Pirellulales bacterium]|nr:sigma-70 family RNA polymerase sigma factor [Pirellulales bacterium]